MSVSPYRLTPEDLPDLDGKTRDGITPLLDALNVTVPQLVDTAGGVVDGFVDLDLVVGSAVADSFPLLLKSPISARPRIVTLANITPNDPDHIKTTPFVAQGFGLTDAGLISVPWITGLLADQTYQLSFYVR